MYCSSHMFNFTERQSDLRSQNLIEESLVFNTKIPQAGFDLRNQNQVKYGILNLVHYKQTYCNDVFEVLFNFWYWFKSLIS